ncbi:MAG: peptidoglycan bridge formation glycyltransferase FemA/FemB family protein [Microgenomates group bacterium]
MTDILTRFSTRRDLHQSPMHGKVLADLGWSSTGSPGSLIYYRPLGPLSVAKLQRPAEIDPVWLKQFRKKHHTLTTYIEPSLTSKVTEYLGVRAEPFAHSSTSLIDLMPIDGDILASFTQKTRYNITHTLKKNHLKIKTIALSQLKNPERSEFYTLHQNWSKQKNVIGYSRQLLDSTIKNYSGHGDLHLAYLGQDLVGALLILYHDSVATYWVAFASPLGYKEFAPTLLTWVAIQSAKANDCEIFDFGGIYDPRYPKMYARWQGFTKFKSGFNPTVVSYPPTTLQLFW